MGLNADLTIIARSEYRRYPRVNPAALAQFDLGKGWAPLEAALRTMPAPLDLALRGDRPAAGRGDVGDGDDDGDDEDAYEAFVPPALVRRTSVALAGVSDDALIAALKSAGFARRKREHAEYVAYFERLKAAYREAAKRDAYLRIFIC